MAESIVIETDDEGEPQKKKPKVYKQKYNHMWPTCGYTFVCRL